MKSSCLFNTEGRFYEHFCLCKVVCSTHYILGNNFIPYLVYLYYLVHYLFQRLNLLEGKSQKSTRRVFQFSRRTRKGC